MSRRKRAPIGGPGRNISPRAVDLWQQCCEMFDQGCGEDDRDFRDLALELHLELGLKPWHWFVTDVGPEPPDYVSRDPLHLRDWLLVAEIRRRLEEVA